MILLHYAADAYLSNPKIALFTAFYTIRLIGFFYILFYFSIVNLEFLTYKYVAY
jgi:hypothetical protein